MKIQRIKRKHRKVKSIVETLNFRQKWDKLWVERMCDNLRTLKKDQKNRCSKVCSDWFIEISFNNP